MQKKVSKAEELIKICEIQNSIAEIFLKEFLEKKKELQNQFKIPVFDEEIVEKIEKKEKT